VSTSLYSEGFAIVISFVLNQGFDKVTLIASRGCLKLNKL